MPLVDASQPPITFEPSPSPLISHPCTHPDFGVPTLEHLLPAIGTNSFFPALLSYLRNSTTCPPLDPVVLQSILLCVIAGDKHLILRTPEPGVSSVAKVAASTLASVFGYPTHRLKIRPPPPSPPDPQGFLRSLFLGASHAPSSDETQVAGGPTRKSSRRFESQRKKASYRRSYSYPNELGYVSSQIAAPVPKYPGGFDRGSTPSPMNPFLQLPRQSTSPSSSAKISNHPSRAHAHIDIASHDVNDGSEVQATLELPRALVVSGLEHAGVAAQFAMLRVLAEKRVILEGKELTEAGGSETLGRRNENAGSGKGKARAKEVDRQRNADDDSVIESGLWNLPEGFIVVYVCPTDARETPPIHKSLLDRFALSSTISLHPTIRHEIHSHRPLSQRSSSTPALFVSLPPPSSRASYCIPQTQEPLLPHALLRTLRSYYDHTYMAPKLSQYTSDLFSAARHHPLMDGRLLSLRARRDADCLIRAGRVICLGGEVTVPLAPVAQQIEPKAKDGADQEEGRNEYDDLAGDMGSGNVNPSSHQQVLDISESDVARIVPRVISHRLRVFDRPEDQLLGSAIFGAVKGGGKIHEGWERSTVKNILVQILTDV